MPNSPRVSAGTPSGGQFAGIQRSESEELNLESGSSEWEFEYHPDGTIRKASCHDKYGGLHCEDGPAIITYHPNGSVSVTGYYVGDSLHREDGPAEVEHRNDGSLRFEIYAIGGQMHREDGPAFTEYSIDGTIQHEQYLIRGSLHREDGPAYIEYDSGGNSWEGYYREGVEYQPEPEPEPEEEKDDSTPDGYW